VNKQTKKKWIFSTLSVAACTMYHLYQMKMSFRISAVYVHARRSLGYNSEARAIVNPAQWK